MSTLTKKKLAEYMERFGKDLNKQESRTGDELFMWLKSAFEELLEGDNSLKSYARVMKHLRQYGADHLMKVDDRANGFYEAVKEIERYFGLSQKKVTIP